MNTDDLDALGDWDEAELTAFLVGFARVSHRLPGAEDLVALRQVRAGLDRRSLAQPSPATAIGRSAHG